MSRTIQVTFDAHDPESLSRFWAAAMGYVNPPPPGRDLAPGQDPFDAWHDFLREVGVPESQWNSASAAQDPDGVGPRLFFQQVPEGKTVKNRLHLDVRAAPGLRGDARMDALAAEADRLVGLGASVLRRVEPDGAMESGFITLQDPEGNELCLD